jgi:hypothetical protein
MIMPAEPPVASFNFPSGPLRGTQLTLYGSRLLHHGVGYMESMPLAAIGAVRVSYERHEQRIGWAVVLVVLAIGFLAASGPLAGFAAAAAAEVSGGQAIAEVLRGALRALEAFAALLPVGGLACLAAGGAMGVLGWLGTTTLVLMLPAAERAFPVRGQSPQLLEFAELLAERVARRLP